MNRSIATTLILLAGSATLSYAQTPAEQASAPATHESQDLTSASLQQDDALKTSTLENGLTYMIRPTNEPAGRVSVRLFVDTGSLDESHDTSGVAHFLEHLVFNGSRHYKRGELIPKMQKLGLGFGGDANAYTSLLHTVYKLDLPNLQDETVDFAFTIMRDFADGATLEDEAIDKERGIVISELKARDSEQYRALINILGQMTEGTRIAEFMPIGKEDVIRNISYQAVRDYYHSHYVPERMTLIITGDVSPAQAEAWVHKYFGSMEKRAPLPRPSLGQLSQTPTKEKLIENNEDANTNIFISVLNEWQSKTDTLEQRIQDYPLRLAFAMFERRMERIVRRADSPFQSAGMDKSSVFRGAEPFTLSAVASPENWEKAMKAAVVELRKAIQYGFSKQEMQEAMLTQLGHLEHAVKTWGSVSSGTMADTLIACLDEERMLTTPQEDTRVLKLAITKLAENPDACRIELEKAFRVNETKLMLSGTLPEGITETRLREVFNEAMQAPVEKPEDAQAQAFVYDKIGEAGTITSRTYLEDIGVTMLTLSNGVKVNLKPVDFTEGSIHVSVAIDGGHLQKGTTKEALSSMVGAVMSQGGLEAHSEDELESLFAGKQVGVGFNASQDRYTFSGPTNSKNLELQCKLLASYIMHPGYRNEGETLLRRRLDTIYNRMETTPEGAYSMQAPRLLFGEDARFVFPTRSQLEAVSTSDVKACLEQHLPAGAAEVTIVGDFNVDEVLPILTRSFGAMPNRKAEFNKIDDSARTVAFQPWGQRHFIEYDTDLDKTLVTQIRPAGNGKDYKRNRRLNVLTSIVREKLFDALRAVLGESYSPRVQLVLNSDFKDAAYIAATSAGVQGNREKVSAAMESVCNGIGQGNITDEDVDRALRPIMTAAEKRLRTADYWLINLAKLQSDPQQLEMIRNMKADLASITADEIRNLAKEIFGKDNANFYYTVPKKSSPKPTHDVSAIKGNEYVVIMTEATAALPEWKKVADTLVAKYPGAKLSLVPDFSQDNCQKALIDAGARYAAYVARPEEIGRTVINAFHRAARRIDEDPWGDCIWGVVTGYDASYAQRIAETKEPLIIKRLLGTTNVHYAPYEHSCCITDWHGSPILEQSGYQEPTSRTIAPDSEEGKAGMQSIFARQLSSEKPQLIVTASHATQHNLEMPFGRGLILAKDNRFHTLPEALFPHYKSALRQVMSGQNKLAISQLAEEKKLPAIAPDNEPRVWLAAGNCLFGDTNYTNQSMVVTALSAYTCNQAVGYTVPSWYGEGGWGTLSLFTSNTTGTSLAEAWFLNNQFLLHKTMQIDKALLDAEFNDERISYGLQISINQSGAALTAENARNAVGLVHDRDTVAFYGDPAWNASIDSTHAPAPYSIKWISPTECTITANQDTKGRCAIWFPNADIARGCSKSNIEGAVLTDDFLLIPTLEMKKGEQMSVLFQ